MDKKRGRGPGRRIDSWVFAALGKIPPEALAPWLSNVTGRTFTASGCRKWQDTGVCERRFHDYLAEAAGRIKGGPCEIERFPKEFVGRETELEEVLCAAETRDAIMIYGPAGVGKTALARRVAFALDQIYKDGQVYFDLTGASAEDAMRHVIRRWAPAGKDESLMNQYRACLANKKAIILVENAQREDQVTSLVTPPGSLLLVTSRRPLTAAGFFVRELKPLGRLAARKWLGSYSPHVGSKATVVAAACGYLPMALEVAGGTLARSGLTVGEYLKRFRKAKIRMASRRRRQRREDSAEVIIEAAIETAIGALTGDDLRRAWRLCGILTGHSSIGAASAVLDVSRRRAAALLEELSAWGLLSRRHDVRFRIQDIPRESAPKYRNPEDHKETWSGIGEKPDWVVRFLANRGNLRSTAVHAYGEREDLEKLIVSRRASQPPARYEVHDLMRLAMARSTSSQEETEGRYRHATYFLGVLQESERLYLEPAPTLALEVLDRNSANIRSALTWASKASRQHDLAAAKLCLAFSTVNDRLLRLRFLATERLDLLKSIPPESDMLKEPSLRIQYHYSSAVAFEDAGKYAEAIRSAETVRSVAREAGKAYARDEAKALDRLAVLWTYTGSPKDGYRIAEGYAKRSLAMARCLPGPDGLRIMCSVTSNLAHVRYRQGHLRMAGRLWKSALKIADRIKDRYLQGTVLSNLGGCHVAIGVRANSREEGKRWFEEALRYFQRAIAIGEELSDRVLESFALGNVGGTFLNMRRFDRTSELDRSLEIARDIGHPEALALSLSKLGEAYAGQGRAALAYDCWDRAAREFESLGQREYAGLVRLSEARFRLVLVLAARGRRLASEI